MKSFYPLTIFSQNYDLIIGIPFLSPFNLKQATLGSEIEAITTSTNPPPPYHPL